MKVSPAKRRSLHVLGIGLATAMMLSACSSSGGSDGGSSLPVVKFGATQNPSSIGTVAAIVKKEKLDTACGVDLEPLSFSPSAADIALLSGQTDMGYFGYNSWASSKEKTGKLAMLAPLQAERGELFVTNDSPAHSLKDLKGKKIALLAPVSGQYQDFSMLVAKMGMSLTDDFHAVTGPPPAVEAFLKRGQVAAAVLFEPNATNLALAGGYRPIFKLSDKWKSITGNPLYMLGISANQAWLSGHEKQAKCVVTAVHKATEMLANDPSVYQDVKSILGAKNDKQLTELAKNLGAIYTPQTAAEATPAIHKQLVDAKSLGLIPSTPSPIFTTLGG